MVVYLRRLKLDSEDNLLARKHVTQSRILERVARILIVLLTLGAALMTFDAVRQYGVSLLASASAASLVVGLALQPMLRNLIAGVQLAITQPIRVDDALLINDEWGNVEEITSSYVVIRLWDLRRMIVPLSYFIELSRIGRGKALRLSARFFSMSTSPSRSTSSGRSWSGSRANRRFGMGASSDSR
jgi:small-conductance mechanosensitive channel